MVGILLGYLASYLFIDTTGGWRYMFGLAALPTAALGLGMVSPAQPAPPGTSPRHLTGRRSCTALECVCDGASGAAAPQAGVLASVPHLCCKSGARADVSLGTRAAPQGAVQAPLLGAGMAAGQPPVAALLGRAPGAGLRSPQPVQGRLLRRRVHRGGAEHHAGLKRQGAQVRG